jgi:uncharacterized protein YjiS (DUF1127 family)
MFGFFIRLAQPVDRHIAQQRLLRSLSRLDDRLLMDIGLRRDQLETMVLDEASGLVPAKPPVVSKRRVAASGPRPSLQGCG